MQFGTSGLRGLVSDMTDSVCRAHVAGFLAHLEASGQTVRSVLIGRDLRPSSPRIADACIDAVRSAGLEARDCGVLPTPALALGAGRQDAAGVMVTGSHIPFDRNGLKFYRGSAEITKTDEAGILTCLESLPPPAAVRGRLVRDDTARLGYLARTDAFAPGCLAGQRIGVYQHSAAGRDLLVEALQRLGATVEALGRSDDFIPIDTEAVRTEDRVLARDWVRAHRLDALVTSDGDGDRPLVADEAGKFVRGDVLGVLTARFLGADAVATPVSSSSVLERSGWFTHIARTRIGSPHVIEAMTALGTKATLAVGFEANGGFLLGADARVPGGKVLDALPTRDALLPILAILSMAAGAQQPLSTLVCDLPPRVTASDRLTDVPPSSSRAFLLSLRDDHATRTAVLAGLGSPAVRSIDTTDGVRMMLEGDEVAHLRASGNAPELRCYVEAADDDRAAAMVQTVLQAAQAALKALP